MPRQFGPEFAKALEEIGSNGKDALIQGRMLIEQNNILICSIQNPGLRLGSEEFEAALQAVRLALHERVFG